LQPPPARRTGQLPPNQFGGLVGTIDHLTLTPHDRQNRDNNPDDNHVYVWIEVAAGRFAGAYECAFNTESNQSNSHTEYHVQEERVPIAEFPTIGFWEAEVSYRGLGLRQTDFHRITNGHLRSQVYDWANDCDLVVAYGVVYQQGDGLHEIHMNSGEAADSTHPNREDQDGALVFYYRNPGGEPSRRWVFIKFSTQTL
jgi:hypothetical protein